MAWIPRNWQNVSTDTGIGDPRLATAEKGQRYAEAVAGRYAEFFAGLVKEVLYQP